MYIKRLWLGVLLCLFIAFPFLAYKYGHEKGVDTGMSFVIGYCFQQGGILGNKTTGEVIACQPLAKVDPKDLQ